MEMATRVVFALWAVFLCCSAVEADVAEDGSSPQDGSRAVRISHRLQLLFPLLIRISTRLATLVPIAMMALSGIFLFVAFSKKAFIASLLALFLTYLDANRREELTDGGVLRVEKYVHACEEERQILPGLRQKVIRVVRPVRGTSLMALNRMESLPPDFRHFLSENVEPGEEVVVRFVR